MTGGQRGASTGETDHTAGHFTAYYTLPRFLIPLSNPPKGQIGIMTLRRPPQSTSVNCEKGINPSSTSGPLAPHSHGWPRAGRVTRPIRLGGYEVQPR